MHPIEIAAETLTSVWGFSITNALFMSWLVVLLLILFSRRIAKVLTAVPSYLQNIVEMGIEALLGLMESILGSREIAEKYLPIVATIFTSILISNWLGIFPGVGSIGFYRTEGLEKVFVPLLRSPASDLNFTLALATVTVFMVNIIGGIAIGFKAHASKFFSFKNPITFFVGILEFVGEIARIISFSFRLFGNVFAGEVLLAVTGFLVPYFVPVPFLMLEIFVGFIQALVFAMLTIVFISIVITHHGEEAH